MPVEHDLVCGLLVHARRVLLVHRRADRVIYPDVWDLPGGHIEIGETPEEALTRELGEELAVVPRVEGRPVLEREDARWRLRVWRIDDWSGDVVNAAPAEHDDIRWFTSGGVDELLRLDDDYRPMIQRELALG